MSTVGIIDKIKKLSKELPEVSLALSLHAPNQAMRSAIVPTAQHFPIEKLVEALDEHMMAYLQRRKTRLAKENGTIVEEFTVEERIKESTRRRAMIEYVMLEGDTCTLEAAHQLGKLCEGRQLVVNLIPYNKTDVKDKLSCPSKEHMETFRSIVASYGAFCTVRRTMGADIDSACGQLITLEKDKGQETEKETVVRDIEDVATDHRLADDNQGESSVAPLTPPLPMQSKTNDNKEAGTQTTVNSGQAMDATEREAVDLDKWILPLAIATTLAASSFIVSSALFLRQRRR